MPCDAVLLVDLSGRGDKDVWRTARAIGETLQP
jgi:tryptophan synthase beta subunit